MFLQYGWFGIGSSMHYWVMVFSHVEAGWRWPLHVVNCLVFVSLRSAFTMHVEAGHTATPEEGPKDLHCPLCLYHTKYKSNMIDHIVLHRGKSFMSKTCWSKGWRAKNVIILPPLLIYSSLQTRRDDAVTVLYVDFPFLPLLAHLMSQR